MQYNMKHMKKYTLFSFVFILSLILLGFGAKSAGADVWLGGPGCGTNNKYSTTTGQPCGSWLVVNDCVTGDLFSKETGQACPNTIQPTQDNSSDVSQFNTLFKSNFKIGLKGSNDVKALQQFLKDQGYYFGKIDGSYGRITARAVKDFQDDNDLGTTVTPPTGIACTMDAKLCPDGQTYVGRISPSCQFAACPVSTTPPTNSQSPVITSIDGPQTLNVNQQGTWSVKASDVSGGNLSYAVNWGDQPTAYALNSSTSYANQQSATFTHSYYQAGNYTPTFVVTNTTTGKTAQTSISVNVGNVTSTSSSITVTRPNGGETWTKGTTQTIQWQDKNLYLTSGFVAQLYDINLISYYPPCTSNISPMASTSILYPISAPHNIAKGVYGSSYDWSIPNCYPGHECSSNFEIASGAYTIQVCKSGTDMCDSSDNYFKIVDGITPPTPTNTIPNIVTGLSASVVSGNSVYLSWPGVSVNSGMPQIATYNIYRSSSINPSQVTSTTTAPVLVAQKTAVSYVAQGIMYNYTDYGLSSGTYFYSVATQDVNGSIGPVSTLVSVTVNPL